MNRATADFVVRVATSSSKIIASRAGDYRVWRSPAGAEVWLHYPGCDTAKSFKPIDDLKGLSVLHRGASDVRMQILRSVAVSPANPLDGVCEVVLEARSGRGRPMPFSCEHVGFAVDALKGAARARVQISGCAHRIWSYPNELAYLAGAPSRRLVGRGSMMEVLPGEVPDIDLIYRTKPRALWLVTGMVRRSIRLTNPVTGSAYAWLLVETDRGDIDIIANPSVIEGDVSIGHTLLAVASMAGRVLERLD
jgi:hypothetical protein